MRHCLSLLFIVLLKNAASSSTTTPIFESTTSNETTATDYNFTTTIITTTTVAPDIIETTLFNRYVFEGVDYDVLPQNLRDLYNDCYGQNIRCVRHRTDHYPVCGYNLKSGYYDDYYGPCEIELQNCYYRVKKGYGIYGTDYKNDIIFYNGEGYNCIYYLRKAKSKEEMHKLYMGEDYDDDGSRRRGWKG
ncbi:uncharacterized protein LOC114248400 [Bombyx mandarina]|uniref:Uncharacterized protein LOC114248400 n=1 Tax=Bombyx mandarina TaxID=7092 RepID=A0A6J2K725_BOMMA|nr:uncharacterized protein LOC114248400 [Bombyx mandarina]